MKNRKLKIKSLTMNPIIYFLYEKYILLLNKYKKLTKKDFHIRKKWFSLSD